MPQYLHPPESATQPRPTVATPQRTWSQIAIAAAVVGILLTGIWFRVEQLDRTPGLNGDEAWSGIQALRFLHGESVAWRTPTGNPLNGFFWGPLVALHTIFPPSIGILRSVSVLSGLFAVGLNYALCRRTFDTTTATVSTILLAVLPITIAYSRFAWDASQTPLAAVLVVYATLAAKRSNVAICITLAAAILVHPTNLFLLPMVVVVIAPLERLRIDPRLIYGGAFIGTAALVLFRGPEEWAAFLLGLVQLFSGSTVYQFISGGVQGGSMTIADGVTLAAFLAASVGIGSRQNRTVDPRDARLALGTSAALVAFLVVAGPRGVQPHLERYALWCVVPIVLIASRGIAKWLERRSEHPTFVQLALLSYAATLLVGFHTRYFAVFERTGGESHLAFRTADLDPKLAALRKIQAAAGNAPTTTIVSQSWWTRLPIAYLSAGDPRVQVAETLPHAKRIGTLWFVELAGSDEDLQRRKALADEPHRYVRSACTDRAGREVVAIYGLRINAADSLKNFTSARFDNEAN